MWGDKTIAELAIFVQKNHPELKGFDRRGLYRMKQFYDTYILKEFVFLTAVRTKPNANDKGELVSSLGTQVLLSDIRSTILVKLSWTHHRTIFSRCKSPEEIEFYLRMSIKEHYSVRELERQISSSLFERIIINNHVLSPSMRESHPDISNTFKDGYVFEFLNLPDHYSKSDL